jgi:hypothetical protein
MSNIFDPLKKPEVLERWLGPQREEAEAERSGKCAIKPRVVCP